ncbi:MAG: protoheme IX farnesyltransferase [Gammaproteobacteria bacterium]|nr:protoheme IX farnesyltransferase [Gammaproteobacteria bacterium]MYF02830.1 protoheme IX farnesyltransferase [Gammaproteobacteria bacterium]MYI76477.1 protoheme IX farnesyltransferase [Gammaproteobacteria bacterium]
MTKPRVVLLMLLCALVGMLLALDPLHLSVPSFRLLLSAVCGLVGIALVAASAAVVNHVVDARIDRQMARTRNRPVPTGRVRSRDGIIFATVLGVTGLVVLFVLVNPLAAWLNLASWAGYGLFYTFFLKHRTSQNIVIGGLFGAAPPLLGWVCITDSIEPEALILVAIIFLWTPPHFWALAIDRAKDYEKVGVPMLPLTHGDRYTRLSIFVYTVLLVGITLVPLLIRMSGWLYLVLAVVLGLIYLGFSIVMLIDDNPKLPIRSFKFSIVYLAVLFVGFVLDHYIDST